MRSAGGAVQRLRDLSRSEAPPLVCAVNIEELWRGARPEEEERVHALVQRFGSFRSAHARERWPDPGAAASASRGSRSPRPIA